MISDHHIALIAIGGLTGAISRYRLDLHISTKITHPLPIGTLIINLIASFLIGFIYEFFKHHIVASGFQIFFITGFLGAFSTFSSYSLHTLSLMEDGHFKLALKNLILNNVLGILMVFFGLLLGRVA